MLIQSRRGVTLFVENIPSRMQWKGLWHLFARHGEVTRTYIAWKLSRGGKRFGFVSFGKDSDAVRAIERLDVFNVYGFRDGTIDPLSQSRKVKIPVESIVSQSESSSKFSSNQKQSTNSGKEMRMDDVERETLIGELAGKDVGAGLEQPIEILKDSVEVATVSSGDADITTPRACIDVIDMGLLPNLLATDSIPEMRKSSWAEEVDKRMNARYSKGDPDQGDLEIDMDKNEEETFRDFFLEMSPKKRPKIVKSFPSQNGGSIIRKLRLGAARVSACFGDVQCRPKVVEQMGS
ncbi:hypothetical protein V6N13_106645 [Hibiscus sabdariffa]